MRLWEVQRGLQAQEGQRGRTRFQVEQDKEGKIQRKGGPTKRAFCGGSTVSPLGTLRVVKDCGTKEGCSEAGDAQRYLGV